MTSLTVTREQLAAALHESARPYHIGKLPDLTACTGSAAHMADADAIFAALREAAQAVDDDLCPFCGRPETGVHGDHRVRHPVAVPAIDAAERTVE